MLLLGAEHVILCNNNQLEAYLFSNGVGVRRWRLPSNIRYLKMLGGPPGRENFIVAVEDGSTYKVFVDRQQPLLLAPRPLTSALSSVRQQQPTCVDINCQQTMLAVVSEDQQLRVLDITAGRTTAAATILLQESGVNSVAWNSMNANLIAYSCNDMLHVRYIDGGSDHGTNDGDSGGTLITTLVRRELRRAQTARVGGGGGMGFVVGFVGTRVFYMDETPMVIIELDHSAHALQLLDQRRTNSAQTAYRLLQLQQNSSREQHGLTHGDENRIISGVAAAWQVLALRSFETLQLRIAALAYQQQKKSCWAVDSISQQLKSEKKPALIMAQVFAHLGRHVEASRMLRKNNRNDLAFQILLDLCLFNDAQRLVESLKSNQNSSSVVDSMLERLNYEKAHYAEQTRDEKLAAAIYADVGHHARAIELFLHNNWHDELIETAHTVSNKKEIDAAALRLYAEALNKINSKELASELYERAGDFGAALELKISSGNKWPELFALAKRHPEYAARVYVPYAEAMLHQDKFLEAYQAANFCLGTVNGDENEKSSETKKNVFGRNFLQTLADGAVAVQQFDAASYYYFLMSREKGEKNSTTEEDNWLADIYYAYNKIHTFCMEPYRTAQKDDADTLFCCARFLAHELWHAKPRAVAAAATDGEQQQQQRILPSGINFGLVLYALSVSAYELKLFRLVRRVGERAKRYRLSPPRLQMRLNALVLHCKTATAAADDSEQNSLLMEMCTQCSNLNAIFQPDVGNRCSACGAPFALSFMSFDSLLLSSSSSVDGGGESVAADLNAVIVCQNCRRPFSRHDVAFVAHQLQHNNNNNKSTCPFCRSDMNSV